MRRLWLCLVLLGCSVGDDDAEEPTGPPQAVVVDGVAYTIRAGAERVCVESDAIESRASTCLHRFTDEEPDDAAIQDMRLEPVSGAPADHVFVALVGPAAQPEPRDGFDVVPVRGAPLQIVLAHVDGECVEVTFTTPDGPTVATAHAPREGDGDEVAPTGCD